MHRNSAAPTPAAHLPTPGGAPPVPNAGKRGIVRKERDEPPGSASGNPPSKKRRQVRTLSYKPRARTALPSSPPPSPFR